MDLPCYVDDQYSITILTSSWIRKSGEGVELLMRKNYNMELKNTVFDVSLGQVLGIHRTEPVNKTYVNKDTHAHRMKNWRLARF